MNETPPLQPDEELLRKQSSQLLYDFAKEILEHGLPASPQAWNDRVVELAKSYSEAREQAARIDERKHLLICLQSDRDINHLEEFLKAETQGITPSNRKEDV